MTGWGGISSSYVESITSTLPLHRLVLFGVGFMAALAVANQTHLSIAETICKFRIGDLIDAQSALLKEATVSYVLIGLASPMFGWAIARALTKVAYSIAARGTDLKNRVADALERSRGSVSMDLEERREEIEILERALERPRSNMKRLNSLCENFSGIASVFLVASFWGNAIDIFIGVASLVGGGVSSIFAIRFFFSEYYGAALFLSQLQGRNHPVPP